MIIRSRIALPMWGEPIENAAVAIAGNQVVDVGRFPQIRSSHRGEVVDLGEQILMPGLINGHCHLDYTLLRDRIAPQNSFTDWISAINARKATLAEKDYIAGIESGLAEAQNFGTTALLNLEAFPELLSRVRPPAVRVWWCAEMIDVRKEVPITEVSNRLHEWFVSNPIWLGGFGLAPHALFTASSKLISMSAEISRKYSVPLTIHLGESREEMRMFQDADGPLFDFLKGIGRPMSDCGGRTPLSLLLENNLPDQRWVIAHLNELSEQDFSLLANGNKFHVAHCPRSHSFFEHTPFPLQRLQRLGFNICLGTDSLASNSTLSLFSEMRELLRKEPWISPREVVAMVTVNGAQALGQGHTLGKMAPGYRADLIGIPFAGTTRALFDAIVGFEGTVPWIMVEGEQLKSG